MKPHEIPVPGDFTSQIERWADFELGRNLNSHTQNGSYVTQLMTDHKTHDP